MAGEYGMLRWAWLAEMGGLELCFDERADTGHAHAHCIIWTTWKLGSGSNWRAQQRRGYRFSAAQKQKSGCECLVNSALVRC